MVTYDLKTIKHIDVKGLCKAQKTYISMNCEWTQWTKRLQATVEFIIFQNHL